MTATQDATTAAISDVPSTIKRVNTIDIREAKTALRACNRDSEEYKELLESVKARGVLQTITVRECIDDVTKQTFYGLVDGLQRFTAAKDAGISELDVKVIKASDYDVLATQIILNVQRIETKPAEYSKQLSRMLFMNPSLTITELAGQLGKSPKFIYDRLDLLKLDNNIAKLVDEEKISLPNAFALAKLPIEEQPNFVDRAMTQTPQEFVPQTKTRKQELDEAARKGRAAAPDVFTPHPRQRNVGEIKEEFEKWQTAPALIEQEGATSALDGFKLGIKWALHMDKISIDQAKAKDEARRKDAEEAKKRREAEKAEKAKNNEFAQAMGVKA